jgi:peptidoglycan/LPS O-acetylase OafA/YrhL
VIFAKNPTFIGTSRLQYTLGYVATELAGAGLIGIALVEGTLIFRALCAKPLRFIGKYSYGFYILHMIWVAAWAALPSRLSGLVPSRAGGVIVALVANYIVTLLVAKLSYDLYESKILRLKKGFEYDSEVQQHKHAFVIE